MTEAAKAVENPKFRVTQAPGFATGLIMHPPDSEIEWVEPEGWDEKRWGKHWSKTGPSRSFVPLNPAAEKLMEEYKKEIERRSKPKATLDDERYAKMEKLVLDMLGAQGEAQAEARRAQARHEELMERLVAAQEKKK